MAKLVTEITCYGDTDLSVILTHYEVNKEENKLLFIRFPQQHLNIIFTASYIKLLNNKI